MSKSSKKPKYKLDPKKIETASEQNNKKDKDWQGDDIFKEILRSKSNRH